MATAYKNVSSGQVVVSDEPRPDLAILARWVEVPVPDETTPTAEELAAEEARKAAAAEVITSAAVDDAATQVVSSASDDAAAGETAAPVEVPVPDETWTHERLDALAESRGIKFPSNTNRAAKVAALTAPASE